MVGDQRLFFFSFFSGIPSIGVGFLHMFRRANGCWKNTSKIVELFLAVWQNSYRALLHVIMIYERVRKRVGRSGPK